MDWVFEDLLDQDGKPECIELRQVIDQYLDDAKKGAHFSDKVLWGYFFKDFVVRQASIWDEHFLKQLGSLINALQTKNEQKESPHISPTQHDLTCVNFTLTWGA